MPRSSVLKGARLAPERRRVRPEEVSWPGQGDALGGARADPLVYSERDVQQLLGDARREALAEGRAAGLEEGRVAGFEAGQREGVEMGRQQEHDQVRGGVEMLAMLAEAIVRERGRIIAGASRDLVQLALTMAERIVRHGLPLEDEAILRAIREALGHVNDARRIVVRLNPREMELVEAHRADLGTLVAADAHIELRSDPSVTPGGCLLDTPELHLDATVETLLERFEQILSAWSERVTLETADEPADASADEPADAPAGETADEPADEPADAPADAPAGEILAGPNPPAPDIESAPSATEQDASDAA